MAKEEVKPRGTWKIVELISFLHERTVFLEVWDCKRCLKIQFKTAKGFLELPVELLYPLELHCNNITDDSNKTELWMKKKGYTNEKFNPEGLTFWPKQTEAIISSMTLIWQKTLILRITCI